MNSQQLLKHAFDMWIISQRFHRMHIRWILSAHTLHNISIPSKYTSPQCHSCTTRGIQFEETKRRFNKAAFDIGCFNDSSKRFEIILAQPIRYSIASEFPKYFFSKFIHYHALCALFKKPIQYVMIVTNGSKIKTIQVEKDQQSCECRNGDAFDNSNLLIAVSGNSKMPKPICKWSSFVCT